MSAITARIFNAGTARVVALYAASFAVAIFLSGLLVQVTGGSPLDVIRALYEGSLGSPQDIGLTIDESVPVLIVALGVIITSRAGIVNIGPEGQLLIGGLCGAAVSLRLAVPGVAMVPATLLAAAAGGAAWAGIAALLRYWRNVDVVISTLLLNFLAIQLVSFAVNRPYLLQEKLTGGGTASPTSDPIPSDARLPLLGQTGTMTFTSGTIIAVVALVVVGLMVTRSRWGFKLRMLGLNAEAARRAGVRAAALGTGALLLSGAFAGLAGGVVLSDRAFRIQTGFSNNMGFNGLLVALIARRNPWATVPVAILFGILRAGGGFVATTGVPRYVVDVMQALIVLAALFPPLVDKVNERRRAMRIARDEAAATAASSATPTLEVAR
ncbi:MAG TPA: ABC transporter permease [Iamia sp.]|nr:ABC transporter permease [Iamia sp.]